MKTFEKLKASQLVTTRVENSNRNKHSIWFKRTYEHQFDFYALEKHRKQTMAQLTE